MAAGECVLQVPLSICMHIEAVGESVLKGIIPEEPQLQDNGQEEELLALMLMAERRAGSKSYWWHYLQTIPEEYDTPLYWSEEERKHLIGTNVYLLTQMMEAQILKDWKDVHAKLVEKYPDVLGGLTVQDYRWALSTIWSRAVGVDRHSRYIRCLAPTLDMCNHHPQAAMFLDELVRYEPQEDALKFHTTKNVATGQQCYLLYGQYSNAKLLYSYGFVASNNPHLGVDYWVRVPPTARDAEWKVQQLLAHELTRAQTYDFQGTLRGST